MSVIKHPHQTIDGVEGKTCGGCGKWKPLSAFYLRAYAWDGHSWQCRECQHAYLARYKKLHKRGPSGPRVKHVVKDGQTVKMCTRCMELKHLDSFFVNKRHWDGRDTVCRACRSKQHKEEYKAKVLARFEKKQ